ncbi:hypothetical protein [Arthrobacter sp. H14-L1]|uniref:hypothetical protein n=1 Tax=Arthrobacter sp. H14-L1 TaxID=2996697 RepID=UPI00226F2227|nr:hypothetical protein [Arthrobacter sp. H14-L1]MCY0905526.1 hypothetical protein [Arthrobacter sp. H14-L1]
MKTPRLHILTTAAVGVACLVFGTACSPPETTPAVTPTSASAAAQKTGTSSSPTPATGGLAGPRAAGNAIPSTGPLRQVHSPGTVAVDEQLAPNQCAAKVLDATGGEVLPDPSCTPGAVDPAVTQDNIDSTICTSGYTATVRPPASTTDRFKVTSLLAYRETANHTIELDHLVSLELGGANSASNLWPELNRAGATGTTNPKDAVENTIHKAVCDHRVKLVDAQNEMARNWVLAAKDLGL